MIVGSSMQFRKADQGWRWWPLATVRPSSSSKELPSVFRPTH